MGHKFWFTTILLYFLPLSITLQAQWCELKKSNGSGTVDTLYFGNNPLATYGIDSLSPTFVEYELPPLPFCSFTRWVNLPHRREMGSGLKLDIRGIPEAPLHKDTFALEIGDWSRYDKLVLRWPDSNYLSKRCDSIFLKDVWWGMPTVDMMAEDSLSIFLQPDGLYKFNILKYGVKLADSEPPPASVIFLITVSMENSTDLYVYSTSSPPEAYSLAQNFPNPFNPSTTIRYQLPQDSKVSLIVYNTLGQVVVTLADEIQQAGYKQAEWNAGNLPSGVYFYRLVAGDFNQVKKVLLIR